MPHAILRDHSPARVARAIEASQYAYWASYAAAEGAAVDCDDAVLLFRTSMPFPLFNGVLRTTVAPAALDATIDATIARFTQRGLPFAWYVGPDSRPDGIAERLTARGLLAAERLTGMALDLRALRPAPAPPGLTIVAVRDADALRQWTQALNVAYDLPAEIAAANHGFQASLGFGEQCDWVHYLGLLDGAPVATAHLLLAEGVAGINMVGTLPAARRRGIGAAITQAALLDARARGYELAVLEATQMGAPVYAALGFRPYYTTELLLWMGGDADHWGVFDR